MAVTEKVRLLSTGLYKDIPDELTLNSIPTSSELEYVGAENFDEVMLSKILPSVIDENINPRQLLEIDYQWILRCMRIMNYGPYINVNAIFCSDCDNVSRGEYMCNLENIECKMLPPGFTNSIKINKDEFIDFKQDIEIKLLTIQDSLTLAKDKQFQDANGEINTALATLCYMIHKIGNESVDPIRTRLKILNNMSPADYIILKNKVDDLKDYGLRAGGNTTCPKCGSKEAKFITFLDERFFRPDVDCLRKWALDRDRRGEEDVSGDAES